MRNILYLLLFKKVLRYWKGICQSPNPDNWTHIEKFKLLYKNVNNNQNTIKWDHM